MSRYCERAAVAEEASKGEYNTAFLWVSRDKSLFYGLLIIWVNCFWFQCVWMFEGYCVAVLNGFFLCVLGDGVVYWVSSSFFLIPEISFEYFRKTVFKSFFFFKINLILKKVFWKFNLIHIPENIFRISIF